MSKPPAPDRVHWKGDRAEYTGNTEFLYGALFYELRLLEGRRKGQTVLTIRPPR